MPDLVIRQYEPEDRAAVIALWSTVFADDPPWNNPADVIDTKLTVQPELFLVAILDGELAGTVIGGFDGVRGWLHHVATAGMMRGRGIAESLIREAERRLKQLGCRKLNLQVRASNGEVVDYYERLGFSVEERVSLGKLLD